MPADLVPPRVRFLGSEEEPALHEAAAVVLPVAYEETVSWGKGAAEGPASMLAASAHLELWDEELGAATDRIGIATHPLVRSQDPPDDFLTELQGIYDDAVGEDRLVALIGGEHSVTLPAARAWRRREPGLSLLQLDAHADLRDAYEGTPLSHACVMRRVCELGIPVVQVGIRSHSEEEARLIEEQGPHVPAATHYLHQGWPDDLADRVCDTLGDPVYVTFDLDVLDPAYLPATGTPEPGGLDWYRALDLLREVFRRRRVVGFDVVELAPHPAHEASAFLAAKLTYRMLGYAARARGWI